MSLTRKEDVHNRKSSAKELEENIVFECGLVRALYCLQTIDIIGLVGQE